MEEIKLINDLNENWERMFGTEGTIWKIIVFNKLFFVFRKDERMFVKNILGSLLQSFTIDYYEIMFASKEKEETLSIAQIISKIIKKAEGSLKVKIVHSDFNRLFNEIKKGKDEKYRKLRNASAHLFNASQEELKMIFRISEDVGNAGFVLYLLKKFFEEGIVTNGYNEKEHFELDELEEKASQEIAELFSKNDKQKQEIFAKCRKVTLLNVGEYLRNPLIFKEFFQ